MAKINKPTKKPAPRTHEGAVAARITPEQALTRTVMACLLWENTFYEEGESVVDRIRTLSQQVSPQFLAETAIKARHDMKLRHVPLMLLVQLLQRQDALKAGVVVRTVIASVISRADEMGELLALYAKENGITTSELKKLDNQLKRGLAQAFYKFDAYQFGKYKGGAVRNRDVIRLVHPKPREGTEDAELFRMIAKDELPTPDTWEVALSGGANKKEAFTRLLEEEKLGGLALLRNLRNMAQAGVDRKLVTKALGNKKLFGRVLPFRFLSATKAAPEFDSAIDKALLARIADMEPFDGVTAVCVDCSGSMATPISSKSQVHRNEAGAALGALIKGDVRMYAFGTHAKEVPARKGLAGIEAILKTDVGHATNIAAAVALANKNGYDRIIVITDEQMQGHYGSLPDPLTDKAYFINVASYENGIGYGKWTNITGFSENTLRYIQAMEGKTVTVQEEEVGETVEA